ncbi:PIN domain-containing protein [Cryobacterium sp. TMT1-3]|uniref:PIN domain-containing protein n=1 Tax=Cryobacterium sp. TMT1-3 TaxID=1259237 RepID=UPI00141AF936|nr:PIN domain-containing protein [Cryobacterium sp. TMT1-3]
MLQRVFVDANVLLSRTTRDWLFLLRNETQQMFQLHSTIDVVTETVRARRRLQPELDGNITRRLHDDLIENLDEVVADFDGSIEFHGSDPHDRHVHAAATAAASNFLLTSNGSDFGNPDLLPYEIYTPDEFFLLVDDGAQDSVRRVTKAQLK